MDDVLTDLDTTITAAATELVAHLEWEFTREHKVHHDPT
jgi:hypothetical protein